MLDTDRKFLIELAKNQAANGRWLDGFPEDAMRIVGPHVSVTGCSFVDTLGDTLEHQDEAHRDGIQIIQPGPVPRAQYAGATLGHIHIEDCHFRSRGQLQGIFCSDGRISNITIRNNVLETAGYHYISLAGLQQGLIQGNVKEDGTPCPIHLWPLRIGGNPGTGTVCVVGYKHSHHAPAPLEEIIPDPYEREFAKDRRTLIKPNPNVTYLVDFDLEGFQLAVLEMNAPKNVMEHAIALQALAKRFGRLWFQKA